MKKMKNILGYLTKFLEILMIIALALMVVVMFMQVVLRYVFSTGIAWSEELTRFLMVYMIFIGGAVLTSYDAHINVTILDGIFKKGYGRKILKTLQYVICLVYCFFMARAGFNSLKIVAMQKSPNMQIAMNFIYVIMPVGMILMMLYIVAKMVLLFAGEDTVIGEVQATEIVEEDRGGVK